MKFQWETFKQSNVARIFIAYAVVAFGLMQVFDYLLPIIEAPLWVAQTLTLLLFLGFPISLLVGWVTQRPMVTKETASIGSDTQYAHGLSRQKLLLIGLGSSAIFGFLGLILMPYLLDQAAFNNPENFYLDGMGLGLIGSYTFDIPGIYEYDCDIGNHAEQGMVGMLTVGQGGCIDEFACNYMDEYDFQLGDCIFAEFNFDCDGNCIVQVDECGLCGGGGSYGDVILDGEINIIDITFLIEYIFSKYNNGALQSISVTRALIMS